MIDIEIYDSGKFIGIARTTDIKDGSIMEVLGVTIDGKEIDVLHVRDMNYGIIIPKHISLMIDEHWRVKNDRY